MSHIVVYRSPEGQAVYHQSEGLEEAARHVEWLRNAGQGKDARIFKLQEVPIEVKTYYRVEVAGLVDSAPAPSTPGTSKPVPPATAAAVTSPPAPASASTAAAPGVAPAATKPEAAGAGVSLNGGRFGLFGKG